MKKNRILNAIVIVFAVFATGYLRKFFPVADMSMGIKLIVFPVIAGAIVGIVLLSVKYVSKFTNK